MTDAYHLKELAIARDAADRRHVNPPVFPPEWRVLDVGCGAGQTLIACFGDRRSVGVDIAMDALRLGRTLTDRVSFVRAAAENLPFADGAFDAVIARVSLPYSNLGRSLREIRRLLKPGGLFWAVLHPIAAPGSIVDFRKPRTLLRLAYLIFNTALFHWTGRVVPYGRGRYESWQTSSGIRRGLAKAGFGRITVSRQTHFVVTAEAAPAERPVSASSGGPSGFDRRRD